MSFLVSMLCGTFDLSASSTSLYVIMPLRSSSRTAKAALAMCPKPRSKAICLNSRLLSVPEPSVS